MASTKADPLETEKYPVRNSGEVQRLKDPNVKKGLGVNTASFQAGGYSQIPQLSNVLMQKKPLGHGVASEAPMDAYASGNSGSLPFVVATDG